MMGSTNDPEADDGLGSKAVAGSIFIAVAVYGVRPLFPSPLWGLCKSFCFGAWILMCCF